MAIQAITQLEEAIREYDVFFREADTLVYRFAQGERQLSDELIERSNRYNYHIDKFRNILDSPEIECDALLAYVFLTNAYQRQDQCNSFANFT
jgi:hypothetical protein